MTNTDPFSTPPRMARFLVTMGYPRDEILRTVQADFPARTDIETIVDLAIEQRDKSRAELAREIGANEAAVAAEHRED